MNGARRVSASTKLFFTHEETLVPQEAQTAAPASAWSHAREAKCRWFTTNLSFGVATSLFKRDA